MVNVKKFKNNIRKLVFQEYNIEFLGSDFNEIVKLMSEENSEKIYTLINKVIEKEIRPILIGSNKRYKEWQINQLLTFRYALTIENNSYRILFVKVKNSIFIEFHLGNHKYYDKVRKNLELKKSSY